MFPIYFLEVLWSELCQLKTLNLW